MDVFCNANMGEPNGRWVPFQAGVILSTISALQSCEYLIVENQFDFVMLGRFTQDCVENLFSMVRASQPKPNCLQFKAALKLILTPHFLTSATG